MTRKRAIVLRRIALARRDWLAVATLEAYLASHGSGTHV
jgi:hypothetical protein